MKLGLLIFAAALSAALPSCSSRKATSHVSAENSIENQQIEALKARRKSWVSLQRPVSLRVEGVSVSTRVFADQVINDPEIPGVTLLKGRVVASMAEPQKRPCLITARSASYYTETQKIRFEGLPFCEWHWTVGATSASTVMELNLDSGGLDIRGPSRTQ